MFSLVLFCSFLMWKLRLLIQDLLLSFFLIWAFNGINFLPNSSLAASQKFWYNFHFVQCKTFSYFLWEFSFDSCMILKYAALLPSVWRCSSFLFSDFYFNSVIKRKSVSYYISSFLFVKVYLFILFIYFFNFILFLNFTQLY